MSAPIGLPRVATKPEGGATNEPHMPSTVHASFGRIGRLGHVRRGHPHTDRRAEHRHGGALHRRGEELGALVAVLLAFIDVIAQIGFLPAYPIWSAIMILLDILVIFALTARWDEAWAAM